MKENRIGRNVIGIIVVVIIIVAGIAAYVVTRPSLAENGEEEENKITVMMVKVPTVGPRELPIVTVVGKNTTDTALTERYTLKVDGEEVETKTLTWSPGEIESLPFELTPFEVGGAHTVEVAGVTKTLTVDPEITTVFDAHPGKIWISYEQEWEGNKLSCWGPSEDPTSFEELEAMITPEVIDEIKDRGFTSAYSGHSIDEPFNIMAVSSLTKNAEKFGMNLLTVAGAEWDTLKEIANLETIKGLHPDLIYIMTTDPDATAGVNRELIDEEIRIVYADMCATDFEWPEDYAGIATADYAGAALASLEGMVEMLRKSTIEPPYEIAQLYFAIPFPATNWADLMVRRFVDERPDIELVHREGFVDPAKCYEKVEAFLPRYPELDAIFGDWSLPTMYAIEAGKGLGRTDLIYGAWDWGKEVALALADPDVHISIAGSDFGQIGEIMIYMSALDLLGYECPAYVAVPTLRFNRANILYYFKECWADPLGEEIPPEMFDWLEEPEDLP